ncbi:hypothetical protein CHU98_g6800, partial [Xylaria longipes]
LLVIYAIDAASFTKTLSSNYQDSVNDILILRSPPQAILLPRNSQELPGAGSEMAKILVAFIKTENQVEASLSNVEAILEPGSGHRHAKLSA